MLHNESDPHTNADQPYQRNTEVRNTRLVKALLLVDEASHRAGLFPCLRYFVLVNAGCFSNLTSASKSRAHQLMLGPRP